MRSENVDSEYDNLRELVSKEQLYSCLPEDIKTYLAEKAPENLKKCVEVADDYSLIHKNDRKTSQRFNYSDSSSVQNNKAGVSTNSNVKPNNMSKGQSDSKNAKQNNQVRKQEGHTNYRNHNEIADRFGNKNDKCNESSDSGVVNCSLPAEFTPFVLEGYVSKKTDNESAKTVKILRDTWCMQSVILTSALPTGDTATGEDVLISGVFGSNRVPLQKFYLKSDLITGFVEHGAIDQLPFW